MERKLQEYLAAGVRLGVWSRYLMDRIDFESLRFRGPDLAEVFVGRQTLEGLEAPSEVVS